MKNKSTKAAKPQQKPSLEQRMAELRQIIAQDEAALETYPKDKNLKADLAILRDQLQELEQQQGSSHSS